MSISNILEAFTEDEKLDKKELTALYYYFQHSSERLDITDEKIKIFIAEINNSFSLQLDLEKMYEDPASFWESLQKEKNTFNTSKYQLARFIVLSLLYNHELAQGYKLVAKFLKQLIEKDIKVEL